jgi:hypothetical protein
MKAKEITDATIETPAAEILVELNGKLIQTATYRYGQNKRGEPVIIIEAKQKIRKLP